VKKWDVIAASLLRNRRVHTARGFTNAGLNVLVLESSPQRIPGEDHRVCLGGLLLAQARRIAPLSYRDPVLFAAYGRFEAFAAAHCRRARAFWGWSAQSLLALEECRRRNIPAILDCGSTHLDWFTQRMEREFQTRGQSPAFTSARLRLNARIAAEYEVADLICVPSSFAAETYLEAGFPPDRLHINISGVDTVFWRLAAKRRSGAARPFRAAYTGSIALRKGVWYLLDAWRRLAPADAELWLFGNMYSDGRALVSNLPPGVRMAGSMSHDQLVDAYSKMDLFVLPTLEEGLSRAVLEAMAAGLPVITTVESGTTDIMKDGEDGWLVPSADSEALAERLDHAMRHRDELPALGVCAQERVAPYTWEAYGERAAALLRDSAGL
jgi:alpha-maltose-1-phosphate synthase